MAKRYRLRLYAYCVRRHDRIRIFRRHVDERRPRIIERRESRQNLRPLKQAIARRTDGRIEKKCQRQRPASTTQSP